MCTYASVMQYYICVSHGVHVITSTARLAALRTISLVSVLTRALSYKEEEEQSVQLYLLPSSYLLQLRS